MREIKELTVFAVGDSTDPKLWSNVPFLFTGALIRQGIKVNRVWLKENPLFTLFYEQIIFRVISLFFKGHQYGYNKIPYNRTKLSEQVRKHVKKHQNSDAFIFLNYDYHAESDKPTILFHDWTFEHNIRVKLRREPFFFEKPFIAYQKEQIEKADAVISMFEKCAEEMKEYYINPNIYFLGGNVVNNLFKGKFDEKSIVEKKKSSRKILFVGNYKYKEGAYLLLEAFKILRLRFPEITLDFIGLYKNDFSNLPSGVTCHGYLDKGLDKENEMYYELLQSATIFVNPTPVWGGYSSTVEAMYFCCPVIVAPYRDFVKEFGEDITFGRYHESNDAATLAVEISFVLEHEEYSTICTNAHNTVKDYTWDNYMQKVTDLIANL